MPCEQAYLVLYWVQVIRNALGEKMCLYLENFHFEILIGFRYTYFSATLMPRVHKAQNWFKKVAN